jgi:hypothetical protein
MPVLPVGSEVVFEAMIIKDRASKRSRTIEGTHVVKRRILKFGSRPGLTGLTQYLEIDFVA